MEARRYQAYQQRVQKEKELSDYSLTSFEAEKLVVISGTLSTFYSTPILGARYLLQTQPEAIRHRAITKPFTSIFNLYQRIYSEHGVFGFWRGFFSQAGCTVIQTSVAYWLYKKLLPTGSKYDSEYYKTLKKITVGSITSAAVMALSLPLDYHRTKMLYYPPYVPPQHGSVYKQFVHHLRYRPPSSLFSVIKSTYEKEGIFSFTKGYAASILGTSIYRGVFFPIFDSCISSPHFPHHLPGSVVYFAFFTMTVAATAAYPFDTIRRRLFVTQLTQVKYDNARHALKEIIKREGFFSLYRGYSLLLFQYLTLPCVAFLSYALIARNWK